MIVYTNYLKGICFVTFEGYFDKKLAYNTLNNISYMNVLVLNIRKLLFYNPSELVYLKNIFVDKSFYLISDWKYPDYDLISFKEESYILKKYNVL